MPGSDWQITPASQTAVAGVDTGDYTIELLLSVYPSGAPFDSPFTLSDGGAGGTFTPSSVTILTGQQSATFKYRNSASGTKTLNVSQSDGYSPSSESVSAVITSGGGSVALAGVINGTERFGASPGLLGGSVGLLGQVQGVGSEALVLRSAVTRGFQVFGRDPAFAPFTVTGKASVTFETFGVGSARRGFGGMTLWHPGGGSGVVNSVQFTGFGRNASSNFTNLTLRNGTTPVTPSASGSLYFSQSVGLDGPSWTAETLVDGAAVAGDSPVVTTGAGGAFLGSGYIAVYQRLDGVIYSRFTPDPQNWGINPPVAIADKNSPSLKPLGRVLGVAVNSLGQIAALTSSFGMYVCVSSDRGQTWSVHQFAATNTSEYAGISAMEELFIVCGWSEALNGMIHFISKDAGATWL